MQVNIEYLSKKIFKKHNCAGTTNIFNKMILFIFFIFLANGFQPETQCAAKLRQEKAGKIKQCKSIVTKNLADKSTVQNMRKKIK